MEFLDRLIDLALDEDLGPVGDVTTRALLSRDATGKAELWAKEPLVLAGTAAFARVVQRVDPDVKIEFLAAEGQWLPKKVRVATLSGRLGSLLTAERTALNLIQRTSGIATLTREAVCAVGQGKVEPLETGKTYPRQRLVSAAALSTAVGY